LAPIRERVKSRLQRQRDEDDRQAMIARLKSRLAWGLAEEDKAAAMAAAAAAIESSPVGASIEQWEKAGQAVIDCHVAKCRLIERGLHEVYRHAQQMLRDFDYDDRETAWRLEERLKPQVEEALRKELNGSEQPDDVVDRVHEIMEEIEGCD
jgi:hypothetical protein